MFNKWIVTPAQAGVQLKTCHIARGKPDSRQRGNDGLKAVGEDGNVRP